MKCIANPWWRHQMETFCALLAICAGNSPVTGEFPTQRPATRSYDVFFDLCLNERLSKQSWGWWFETPSHPLWRHSDALGTLVTTNKIKHHCLSWQFINASKWGEHHGFTESKQWMYGPTAHFKVSEYLSVIREATQSLPGHKTQWCVTHFGWTGSDKYPWN